MNNKTLPPFVLATVLATLAASLLNYRFASPLTVHAQTTTSAEWSVVKTSRSTVDAFATKAAATGITHVADCMIVDATNAPGVTPAGPIGVILYDGSATTTHTVLLAIDIAQPSYEAGGGQVHLCGLNLPGTVGRPMQLQVGGFTGTSPYLSVNLVGHDQ